MSEHTYLASFDLLKPGRTVADHERVQIRARSPHYARAKVRAWAEQRGKVQSITLETAGPSMAGVVMRCPRCDWHGDSSDVLRVDGYLYACPNCGDGGVR